MYKALKPCSFGDGQKYYIDDLIPDEVIAPTAVVRLINMGYITKVKGATGGVEGGGEAAKAPIVVSDTTLSILLKADDGNDFLLEPTDHGIQDIFSVLVSNADNAIPIIKQMDDKEALLLLSIVDARKTVKVAAEARAKELVEEEAGEQ